MRKQGITKRFPVFALIFGILKTASIMPCKEDRKKFPKILHLFVFSKVICDLYLSEISLQHQYLPLTKANKNNGLSTLRKTPLPLKSERCFCIASAQCPEVSGGFEGTPASRASVLTLALLAV